MVEAVRTPQICPACGQEVYQFFSLVIYVMRDGVKHRVDQTCQHVGSKHKKAKEGE